MSCEKPWYEHFIKKTADGRYECWDETSSEIVCVVGSMEEAIDALIAYAESLEPKKES